MNYYTEYEYHNLPHFGSEAMVEEAVEDFFAILLPVLLVSLTVGLLIGLVLYIFQSVGLYKMAKQCGLSAPWLAWIPVGNQVVLGQLAQRSCAAYGKHGLPYAVLLPVGSVLSGILSLGSVSVMTVGIVELFADMWSGITPTGVGMVAAGGVLYVLCLVIAITTVVFQYMALYKVYRLFAPENATLYTVLSVLFSVVIPFLLFAVRNRQPGQPMQSAYVPPAYQPVQPAYMPQPPTQPTDTPTP